MDEMQSLRRRDGEEKSNVLMKRNSMDVCLSTELLIALSACLAIGAIREGAECGTLFPCKNKALLQHTVTLA